MSFRRVTRYSLTRKSDISDIGGAGGSAKVTLSDIGGGQKCVFSGDVICERPLSDIECNESLSRKLIILDLMNQ